MLIQYSYACITMLPSPLWFRYRWASAIFLLTVFVWSVYNGMSQPPSPPFLIPPTPKPKPPFRCPLPASSADCDSRKSVGATYYIDVFGTRFQKELEALKRDVAKWQGSSSPPASTATEHAAPETKKEEAGSAEMTRPVGGNEGFGKEDRGLGGDAGVGKGEVAGMSVAQEG